MEIGGLSDVNYCWHEGGGRDGGGSTSREKRGGLLFLNFSNTERREVVFRTQWFIDQYCSEREGRGYRCRCTSVSLSLCFISIL